MPNNLSDSDDGRDTTPTAGIAQVADRPLYIGDELAAGANGAVHEHTDTFRPDSAIVFSVNLRECPLTTHHHPLTDGYGNDEAEFRAAMEHARALYEDVAGAESGTGPMLVNCAAGVSRSTTTVATVIAATEGITFEEAVLEVKTHRPKVRPHPALIALAESYLADLEGVPASHENAGIEPSAREYRYEWERYAPVGGGAGGL